MKVATTGWTRRCLTLGAIVSAACFLAALLLELAGRPVVKADPSDLAALAGAVLRLEPWGWATLGTLAIIATPPAGLAATALEYRRADDRRTSLTALAVLGVLALSLLVALLARPPA